MYYKIFAGLIILLIFSLSCVSIPSPQEVFSKNTQQKLFKKHGKSVIIEIGVGNYHTNGKGKDLIPGGFFVLLEERAKGVWNIKKISETPITRESSQEEILYVSLSNTAVYIDTYYEDYKITFLKDSFLDVIGYFFDCRKNNPNYSPCNSKLTSVPTIGLYGKGYVRIDRDKIGEIVMQTNLIEREEYTRLKQECTRLKQVVDDFKNKILIEPQIINESGFYTDSKFIGISKEVIGGLKCPIDLNNVKYSIRIGDFQIGESTFVINVDPPSYTLMYNPDGYSLKPVVTIISKKINKLYPQDILENQSLAIRLNQVEANHSKVEFSIDVTNKDKKFISIQLLSFYINDFILTPTMAKIELPPESTKDNIKFVLSRQSTNSQWSVEIFDGARDSIENNISKNIADKTFIKLGISVKYYIDDVQQTLYKTNTYRLADILK